MPISTANLTISVTDLRATDDSGAPLSVTYHFEGGLRDFVLGNVAEGGKTLVYPDPIYVERKTDDLEMMLAVIHTEDYAESVFSFVNNIPTTEGGTHEAGFKSGYTKAFNEYARAHNILKDKQANLLGEDYREGMTAVLAIKLREVQFEGQTKTKLGNPRSDRQSKTRLWNCSAIGSTRRKKRQSTLSSKGAGRRGGQAQDVQRQGDDAPVSTR